jgi:NAD(P)H dehydrogenase (quinone)
MICVMAATGEVGKATVDDLLRLGVEPSQIVAAGRNPKKMEGFATRGVTVRPADYQDGPGLVSAFRGVETLILIPTKTPAAPRCVEHANALQAAKSAGVKRIVFLSIQAATPTSRFNVAPFILFAESATRQSGIQWTFARMSLYSDPVAEWAPALARTGRLPYPLKTARIAYVARADVSRTLAAIGRRDGLHGCILELTGPAPVSMPELALAVSNATSAQVKFATVTFDEYREICRQDNLPQEIIDILVTMYEAAEAQEFSNATTDILSLTGVAPESVSDTLARLLKSRA